MAIAAATLRRTCLAAAMLLAILALPWLAAVGRGAEPAAAEKKTAPALTPEQAEIVALFQQGMALSDKGQWAEAAPVLEKAAARAKAALGPDNLDTAHLTMRYADALYHLTQYEKALPLFVESVAVLRRRLPREHPVVTYAVNELAVCYYRLGRSADAVPLQLENLKVREASLGKEHPHTLITLCCLGRAYHAIHKWDDAIRICEDWLQRNERRDGEKSSLIVEVLCTLGGSQLQLSLLESAEKNLLRALKIQRARKGADEHWLATTLDELAEINLITLPPRLDRVKLYADEAYEIRKRIQGPNDVQTLAARGALAVAYQRAGKLAEAEPLLREVIKTLAAIPAGGETRALWFEESLATIYLAQHRAAEAEAICLLMLGTVESHPQTKSQISAWFSLINLYTQACNQTGHAAQGKARLARLLSAVEKQVGKDNISYAQALAAVGAGYRQLGANAEAKRYLLQSVSILRAALGSQSTELARALLDLGMVCRQMSSLAETERYCTESRQILIKAHREYDRLVATDLNELGYVYMRTERTAEAVKCFNEVLRIAEKNPGATGLDKARAMGDLGRISTETGHPREAEPLLQKALALYQQLEGAESSNIAWTKAFLGDVYFRTGRQKEAEQAYREALRMMESFEGKDHPEVAPMISRLRESLEAKGQHAEADKLLARDSQLYQAHSDMSQRDHICQLNDTVASAMRKDDYQQAIRATTELRRLSNRWLKSVLPGMPQQEQLIFLGADHWWGLARSMSVGFRYREHPEAVEASAQWLVNGKAMAGELLADEIRRARQSSDPAVAETLHELADVRDQLAHAELTRLPAGIPGQAENREPSLLRRERELTMRLGMQTYDVASDDAWITLEDVRKAIPVDAVLVDVFRFPIWRSEVSGFVDIMGSARYAAWVVPPAGKKKVTLVDLGPADLIDRAVARYRQAIESFMESLQKPHTDPLRDATFVEAPRLAALVWKPLEAAVGDAQGLIVSPDGALWLIPWAALPTGPNEFLVEQKRVRYVVSGRALLAKQSDVFGRTGVLFADPDYDRELVPGSNEELEEWLAAEKRNWGKPHLRLTAAGRIQRLPTAEADTAALAKALEHYLHEPPIVYKRGEAQERTFKRLKNPRVLVVDTHGLFQADPRHDNLPSSAAAGLWGDPFGHASVNRERSQSFVNPLLRCSLALAGANHRFEAQGGNDGILTGLEILNTDLRGTDLVVLLACQSGLGAVEDGEGVAGMHHAFQLAGAKTVLASLWSIPSQLSGELVHAFLENLATQPDKAAALRKAQLKVIAEEREKCRLAPPALWAGLVLVGDAKEATAKAGKK